jgi:hypothetical protein
MFRIHKLGPMRITALLALACCSEAQTCPSATISLNVLTRDGSVVRGLLPNHFAVDLNGRRAKIETFELDSAPRRVILVVDTSGSMRRNYGGGWRVGLQLAAYAINTIPADASVAFVTFNDKADNPVFGDRQQAASRLSGLGEASLERRTSLFDTVQRSLMALTPPRFGDLIYLVTDGGDNYSKITLTQLTPELARRGTRIFVVLAENPGERTEEDQRGRELMSELVRNTGGYLLPARFRAVGPKERAELLALAPIIQAEISSVYRLRLSSPEPITKTASVKVRYTGPNKSIGKGFLFYPRKVGPCVAE